MSNRPGSQARFRWFVILALALIGIAIVVISIGGRSPFAPDQNLLTAFAEEATVFATPAGAEPFDEDLTLKLAQAWINRPSGYKPRTKHLNADGSPKYVNRLFLESSPYLLQHAHNPVNWRPWGDEAFEAARALNRPVLLSVGYSTCHWCHVMEEESFDDEEIARFINENYVAIKVDREVRPDVDTVYMTAVQALTGHGGWPMTVWLTPDRKPYYGGTYFPARDGDRGVAKGFLTLLRDLSAVYHEEPEAVADRAVQITAAIEQMLKPQAGDAAPDAEALHRLAEYYTKAFDPKNGGLRGAPKFPSSMSVRLLLRYHRRTGDEQALSMATLTLEKMARGGIYDQVGGGFHRYATDVSWLVPHFEKMLYDNALLITAYLEGYQAAGREDFAAVAREILRYVERDMTSPQGAFYSATDADSLNPEGEREEGWFFTWTPAEIEQILGADRARLVNAYFGITPEGNLEGRNILRAAKTTAEAARELNVSEERVEATVREAKEALYTARNRRPPPLRDEKILTSWNALMISAHAQAAFVLDDERYLRRAERAATFLLENLVEDGRLMRSYLNGQGRQQGYLDDHAFLIAALLDLYETGGNLRWLQEAIPLQQVLDEQYWDREYGAYFATSEGHEQLIAREKPGYDGAEPSGNSVAAMNLLRLHELTTNDEYRQRAEQCFRAFAPVFEKSPASLSEMLLALDFHLDTPKQIIVVAPSNRQEANALLAPLRRTFLPNRVLAAVAQGAQLDAHAALVPLLEEKRALRGQPTAYVCERRVCELPTGDPAVFAKQVGKVEPLPPRAP